MVKKVEPAIFNFKNTVKNVMIARIIFALTVLIGVAFFGDILIKSGLSFWLIFFIIVWLIILWRFWFNIAKGSLTLTFMLGYFFVAIVISVIALALASPPNPNNAPNDNSAQNGASVSSGSSVASNDCSQWVDYTGPNAKYFTFKYPKCYTIEENERSTWVNNNKPQLGDDHFLVSWYDGPTTPYATCLNYTSAGETPLYAKSATLGGVSGCERSLTKMNDRKSDTFTLVIWDLRQPQRDWTVLFWARAQEDQDIFHKMAESLVIK